MPDAVAHRLGERIARDGEEQHGDPGPAVRRLLGGELALDAGLDAAADHRGGEAGHAPAGVPRPAGVVRGDDEARPLMPKASAKVSSMATPLELHARLRGRQGCANRPGPASASSPSDRRKCAEAEAHMLLEEGGDLGLDGGVEFRPHDMRGAGRRGADVAVARDLDRRP